MGSRDDNPPKIVDVKRETLLAILVYPDGRVHFSSSQPEEWVLETLQRITDAQRARVFAPMGTSMDVIECSTCRRMFPNTNGSGVCPAGHQNAWADEDELDRLDYLGKVQG